MKLFLSCNKKNLNSEIITNSLQKEEIYFNDLKQADNSASCTIPYNLEIQNFINAFADQDIKAEIKEGNNYLFTGYLRKNFTFSKKQRNQPIKIEIVSPSFLLDRDLPFNITKESATVGEIVDAITESIGITSNVKNIIKDRLLFFIAEKQDSIKDVLNNLLFEYGYCYDFDAKGNFNVYPIFNVPDFFDESNSNIFDGTNCLDEIKITKKEQQFDNALIQWKSTEIGNDSLIFADTTNGTSEKFTCKIELQPHKYLGGDGETPLYYINYDSTLGELLYVKNARFVCESSNNSGLVTSFRNLNNKGELSIYNKTDAPITITKINVFGDFYYQAGINKTAQSLGKKTKDYESNYIQIKANAKYLCEKYSDYLKYADYSISLKSKSDYPLGSFVKITDEGLGIIYGRILKKKVTLKNKVIQYSIEAVSEYEKAEATTTENKDGSIQKDGVDGVDGADGIDGADGVDGTSGLTIFLEKNALIYSANSDGFISEEQAASTAHVIRDGQELDFNFGKITNPPGFEITTQGKDVLIKALSGDLMQKQGDIKIPLSITLETNKPGITKTVEHNLYISYAKVIKGLDGIDGTDGASSPRSFGVRETAPTEGEIIVGDYYINTSNADGKIPARIYRCKSITKDDPRIITWEMVTPDAAPELYNRHVNDLMPLIKVLPENDVTKKFVNTYVEMLLADTTFTEKLFAKAITLLKGGEIKSENYDKGYSGFMINSKGEAEFYNANIRGNISCEGFSVSFKPGNYSFGTYTHREGNYHTDIQSGSDWLLTKSTFKSGGEGTLTLLIKPYTDVINSDNWADYEILKNGSVVGSVRVTKHSAPQAINITLGMGDVIDTRMVKRQTGGGWFTEYGILIDFCISYPNQLISMLSGGFPLLPTRRVDPCPLG